MTTQPSETAAGFVLAAIEDCQDTIRALDVKAEILAAFAGLVGGGAIALTPTDCTLGTISFAVCALAIVAIGLVVCPRTAPAVPLGAYVPTGAFFPPPNTFGTGDATKLAASALATDWVSELSFELLKLSAIRKAKARYFKIALWLTGAGSLSFAVAAIAQRI